MKKRGIIYFALQCGRVKIGFTRKLTDRLLQLQHNPIGGIPGAPVRLLHYVVGTRETERDFHRRFKNQWCIERWPAREWFNLSGELEEYLRFEGII